MSHTVVRGRCHCGEVQLEVTAPLGPASHCHCESCRQLHGAAFVTWTSVPEGQLQVHALHGIVRGYSSSPGVYRSACGHCGTPLLYRSDEEPGRVYVAAAVLKGWQGAPSRHVSWEERVPWIEAAVTLPVVVGKTGTA